MDPSSPTIYVAGVVYVIFVVLSFVLLGLTVWLLLVLIRLLQTLTESWRLRITAQHARLDSLERLKRRDMVTPEEYAAKRQEILKDL